jgi:GxxExxY protein
LGQFSKFFAGWPCLAHELRSRQHLVECEVALPLQFEGTLIEVGYRIDMRIDKLVLVENKTVDRIAPIHVAQLLTYLKLKDSLWV